MTSRPAMQLTKDEKRAAAKARAEARRADAAERARVRQQPLPDGTFLVRLDKKVTAVRVTAGLVETQTERDGSWAPLDIREIGRGGWLWSRTRLTLGDGSRKRACVYYAREQGMADVGRPDQSSSGGILSGLGNDPISMVIALVFLAICICLVPFVIAGFVRHSRGAGRLIRAVSAG